MPALTNAECNAVIKAIGPHRGEACGESGIRMGGRGNLRVAKTPPLQSALRGDRCGYAAPIAICAHGGINGNGERGDNDAARRVATSSEKWENRF